MDPWESAQGAVDSLLGTLASVIRDEAKLLGNVRGDVQFIKDEMESMNGFLLHMEEASEKGDHQVRAWMRQVRDVAVGSEQWVARYNRWAATAPTGVGVLGFLRRIPHTVLTVRERHEIATNVRELKARAQEVGDRRQRYGVEVPSKPPGARGSKGQAQAGPRGGEDDKSTEEKEKREYDRRRWLEDLDAPPPLPADFTVSGGDVVVDGFYQEKLRQVVEMVGKKKTKGKKDRKGKGKLYKEELQPDVTALLQSIIQLICPSDIDRSTGSFSASLFLRSLCWKPGGIEDTDELCLLCGELSSYGCEERPRCMLQFCYNEIPVEHRSCLLYLSIFPPDAEIRRTSLLRRWVAEGMIVRRAGLTALDAAESSFTSLFHRGFLVATKFGAAGNPKSVKVPRKILDFIVETSRSVDNGFAASDLYPNLARYLSIGNGIRQVAMLGRRHRGRRYGILQCVKAKGTIPEADADADLSGSITALLGSLPAIQRLGLLKVLDLLDCEGLRMHHLKIICQIPELRYLSLRGTGIKKLPIQIYKLQNLETLDIRQTKVKVLPKNTYMLQKLKHLLSGKCQQEENGDGMSDAVSMPHGVGYMADLQILSHVKVSSDDQLELIAQLDGLQKLRKLGLVLCRQKEPRRCLRDVLRAIEKLSRCLHSLSIQVEASTDEEGDNHQDDAIRLITLPEFIRSLKIRGIPGGVPCYVHKLKHLIKITLQQTFLRTSDLDTLGSLASLRCLRLIDDELEGHSMDNKFFVLRDGQFKSLQFLYMERCDITDLSFQNGAAPKLEKIVWLSPNTKIISLTGTHELKRLRKVDVLGKVVFEDVQEAANQINSRNKWDVEAPGTSSHVGANSGLGISEL